MRSAMVFVLVHFEHRSHCQHQRAIQSSRRHSSCSPRQGATANSLLHRAMWHQPLPAIRLALIRAGRPHMQNATPSSPHRDRTARLLPDPPRAQAGFQLCDSPRRWLHIATGSSLSIARNAQSLCFPHRDSEAPQLLVIAQLQPHTVTLSFLLHHEHRSPLQHQEALTIQLCFQHSTQPRSAMVSCQALLEDPDRHLASAAVQPLQESWVCALHSARRCRFSNQRDAHLPLHPEAVAWLPSANRLPAEQASGQYGLSLSLCY